MTEVISAANSFDKNPDIGAMVITGNEKAFAGEGCTYHMLEGLRIIKRWSTCMLQRGSE